MKVSSVLRTFARFGAAGSRRRGCKSSDSLGAPALLPRQALRGRVVSPGVSVPLAVRYRVLLHSTVLPGSALGIRTGLCLCSECRRSAGLTLDAGLYENHTSGRQLAKAMCSSPGEDGHAQGPSLIVAVCWRQGGEQAVEDSALGARRCSLLQPLCYPRWTGRPVTASSQVGCSCPLTFSFHFKRAPGAIPNKVVEGI